ncbi:MULTISPECIES: hypothetical protein [unclassified Caballeronia]|uniref:hypothetical protein n=1 Tax=unclassified Caballeronia TaxID=2646786 RepID=UPI002028CB02|nr:MULTISPECIES: hypothetical protein [unclassified Caballeronia]
MEKSTNELRFPFANPSRYTAFGLAFAATATACCISALAGWQRGGSLAERLVWVSVSLALVTSAHLLPALVRDKPAGVRAVTVVMWIACMATACYGHATFFLVAQRHSGELRASVVLPVPAAASSRSLTAVMAERAIVIGQLTTAQGRHCVGTCTTLNARRVTLAARLDALDAEAGDVQRRNLEDERVATQLAALLADPVASRLATLLGTTEERVDLVSGLAFAAVLEGVACLLWAVALVTERPPAGVATARAAPLAPATEGTTVEVATTDAVAAAARPEVATVAANRVEVRMGSFNGESSHEDTSRTVGRRGRGLQPTKSTEISEDLTQLARDIDAGRVRPTVTGIRRHLGCSQARAVALRRRWAEHDASD